MTDKTETNNKKTPSFIAYAVREGAEDKSFFNEIGVAFNHQSGDGLTILLNAVPLDGKIVCREITEGEEPTENVTPMRSSQPDRQAGTGRGKR